ncbi:hypothetical protein ACE6H2_011127 [Prunus campanulata]
MSQKMPFSFLVVDFTSCYFTAHIQNHTPVYAHMLYLLVKWVLMLSCSFTAPIFSVYTFVA